LIQLTCPCCGTSFPWEAGLVEADAKRLGAVLADMEPALARAAMSYLRLFKPPKTALRLQRAVKLLQEVADLVAPGTVCRDERSGVRRPAPSTMWCVGIEQMLHQADRLTLPLASHGYLRQVVFRLADEADAAAERQREADKRAGRHLAPPPAGGAAGRRNLALHDALMRIDADLKLGLIDPGEADRRIAEAREQHGRAP
jgi:hypothetical protein